MGVAGRLAGAFQFGLAGLPARTRRSLLVAFSTSIATVMGAQLVYPVLPAMMGQLGVDESAIGLVLTAYTLPILVLAPLAGGFADLHGRRPLLFAGLLVFGMAGAAVAVAPTFAWVLVLRTLQGIGAGALTPLTIVLLSDLLQGEHETGAQGAKVVLDRVATSAFPVLAGALAVWAWNIPFLLYGLAVPVAILGLAWLPETRVRRHTSLRDYLAGFPAITRRPRLLVAFAAGFLRFFLDYGYFTYLPVYLALKRGTSSAEVGVLLAAFAVGAMLTASQAAHLARGHDPARVVFVGFLLAGLSVLAIPFLPFTLLVGASLFVYGLGNGIISPMQKSLLMRNAPADLRAGVVSLDRIVQQAAKTLAPAAMGVLLLVANVEAVFWTLGGLSLGSIALAGVLLTARSRQVPAVAVDPIRSS